MTEPLPLSCFIIAKNEADRIGRTLASVKGLADEIIVIDSGSTDDTMRIAQAAGAKIFHHDWQGYGPQKRFAERQCRHDWVLNLDADEVLSAELVEEIRSIWHCGTPPLSGYRFHQTMVYPGRDRPRLWADYHNYVRLYDRRVMRFSSSPTHDTVEADGHLTGQLSHIALHYSWRSLGHLAAKYNHYTNLQAKTLAPKPWFTLLVRLFSEFELVFLKYYVGYRHFTGGMHGFAASGIIAWSRWRRIIKLVAQKLRQSRSVS